MERGVRIVQVEARSQSSLRYEIVRSVPDDGVFAVNPSTGIITNSQALDYETRAFYNLTVSAANMVGVRAVATVSIHVLDVNDNVPAFRGETFEGQVSETASPGSLVFARPSSAAGQLAKRPLVIEAADADTGVNSLLLFEILNHEAAGVFSIDESTGALR